MYLSGGGGNSHIKKGCLSYLTEVKKVVLVHLRVFSLKRSTARALVVPFRVLHGEKWEIMCCVRIGTS